MKGNVALDGLTKEIIGAAIEVHRHLGPGLYESAYESCLHYELTERGIQSEPQLALPVIYKEIKLDKAYRIDLLVESRIVVELKAVDQITDLHKAQVLTYLKLSGHTTGLLLNFNVKLLKNGIHRFIMSK